MGAQSTIALSSRAGVLEEVQVGEAVVGGEGTIRIAGCLLYAVPVIAF
jgi:hypothetical protein